jgi:hypothetical protein
VHRSADRTRLYFLEGTNSAGPVFTYDATTDSFGPRLVIGQSTNSASAAVSRDGNLLLTRSGYSWDRTATLDRASDYHFIRAFHNQIDGAVAFDAVSDTIYAMNGSAQALVAYDTNTFGERFRIPARDAGLASSVQFGTGNLIADQNGSYLAYEMSYGIDLYTLPTPLPAPSPAPAFLADPQDIVFDNASGHLYISTGTGFVFPFNLTTGYLEAPYDIGGKLGSIDISPDDSTLLVGQGIAGLKSGVFHKIDLATGAVTNLESDRRVGENLDSEGGALEAAIAANGLAIATVSYSGGPMTQYFREINLSTDNVTTRSDTPPNTYPAFTSPASTQLYPSGDRSLIYCMQLTDASEAYNYYSSTNQFGSVATANENPQTGAANRDGTLIARRVENQPTTLQTASSFSFVHSFDGLDSGLTFNQASDVLYGVSTTTDNIVGYNTNTFAQELTLPIGEDMPTPVPAFYRFGSGRLVSSHNGRYLALITPSAIRIYDVTAPIAAEPTISPNGGSFKKKAAIKLSSITPGASVYFTIDGGYPNTSSPVYVPGKKGKAGIIIVGKGTYTLRAISVAPGYNNSAVATAVFTIK